VLNRETDAQQNQAKVGMASGQDVGEKWEHLKGRAI